MFLSCPRPKSRVIQWYGFVVWDAEDFGAQKTISYGKSSIKNLLSMPVDFERIPGARFLSNCVFDGHGRGRSRENAKCYGDKIS